MSTGRLPAGASAADHFDAAKASLILAGVMCVVPFVQPRHFPPIRTFYDEWLAFAFGLAAIGLAAFGRRTGPSRIPFLAIGLGLFALVQLLRSFGAQAAYPQSAMLWALYALFAALLVVIGRDQATRFGREQTCDLLASFLVAGSIANALFGILQVIGIPGSIDPFVSYLHGTRAIGNVGQPNLYANYLALGVASLCYLYVRARLGAFTASSLALLLLTGMALSVSRSSLLFLSLFLFLGWVAMRRYQNRAGRRLCVATSAVAIVGSQLYWAVPAAARAMGFLVERNVPAEWTSGVDPSSGLRLYVWQLAWRLFATSPWIGVGPGEFSGAAFAHGLPKALAGGEVWTSAHNAALQLLSETGLAGALPIGMGLLAWILHSRREVVRGESLAMWWLVACVGVELTHALVEYPLWYGNFLAVTGLLAGIAAGEGATIPETGGRGLLAVCALLGGLLLAGAASDYARFDLARSASSGRSLADESRTGDGRRTLRTLREGLLAPRIETSLFLGLPLSSEGLVEKLEIGQRVLRVWPSIQVASRQSIYLALAGRGDEAVALLDRTLNTTKAQRIRIGEIICAAPQPARSILQPVLR